jgi:tRNA A-37 threonylcarbamoyl transferase component Bud32
MSENDVSGELEKDLQHPDFDGSSSVDNDKLAMIASDNQLVAIEENYMQFFPEAFTGNNAYQWFQSLTGTPIKEEAKTSVTLLSVSGDNGCSSDPSFVLKTYRYPRLARLRTVGQIPRAEREYRALKQCEVFGIPAVKPVGYGFRRGPAGMLRSCFVISRHVKDAVDFRAWLRQGDKENLERHEGIAHILRQLGRHMQRLHNAHFFLMRPTLRNILLCDTDTPYPNPIFVDLAYSLSLTLSLRARYGQRVDLENLFGPLLRRNGNQAIEPFPGDILSGLLWAHA